MNKFLKGKNKTGGWPQCGVRDWKPDDFAFPGGCATWCEVRNREVIGPRCQDCHCLGCRRGEMAFLAVDAMSLLGSKLPCEANVGSLLQLEKPLWLKQTENTCFLIHGNVITLYSAFETLENFGVFPISMISLRKKERRVGFHAICCLSCMPCAWSCIIHPQTMPIN